MSFNFVAAKPAVSLMVGDVFPAAALSAAVTAAATEFLLSAEGEGCFGCLYLYSAMETDLSGVKSRCSFLRGYGESELPMTRPPQREAEAEEPLVWTPSFSGELEMLRWESLICANAILLGVVVEAILTKAGVEEQTLGKCKNGR